MKAYAICWIGAGHEPRICIFSDNADPAQLNVYESKRAARKVLDRDVTDCVNGRFEVRRVKVKVE